MYRDRTMAGKIELRTIVCTKFHHKVLHCSQICKCRLLPTLNFITLIIFGSEYKNYHFLPMQHITVLAVCSSSSLSLCLPHY